MSFPLLTECIYNFGSSLSRDSLDDVFSVFDNFNSSLRWRYPVPMIAMGNLLLAMVKSYSSSPLK